MTWEKHWKIIFSYLEEINKLKVNLFISLHPRMQIKMYKFLENKYRCFILEGNLSEYIGSSDIFIATNSTVLSWSILCNIKTVVIYSPIKSLLSSFRSIFYEPDPKKLSKLLSNLIIDKDIQNNEDFENLSREEVFFGKSLEKHYKCFKTVSKIYCQKS